jgi:hypothetical protein
MNGFIQNFLYSSFIKDTKRGEKFLLRGGVQDKNGF